MKEKSRQTRHLLSNRLAKHSLQQTFFLFFISIFYSPFSFQLGGLRDNGAAWEEFDRIVLRKHQWPLIQEILQRKNINTTSLLSFFPSFVIIGKYATPRCQAAVLRLLLHSRPAMWIPDSCKRGRNRRRSSILDTSWSPTLRLKHGMMTTRWPSPFQRTLTIQT